MLGIPVSRNGMPDLLVWPHEINGKISVKSCYKLLHEERGVYRDSSASRSTQIGTKFSKCLWSHSMSSKIKIFVWKAVENFLLAKNVLIRRGICYDNICPFCLVHVDDSAFAFRVSGKYGCLDFYLICTLT